MSEAMVPGWKEYVQWSRDHRDYTGDPEAKDPHSFLLSLGVETVPHGSNAKPGQEQETFDSIEDLLKAGSFWDHLHGNEQVVRKWQELDGAAAYPDAVCHAALFHSSEPSPSLLLISPHPTCRPASTVLVASTSLSRPFHRLAIHPRCARRQFTEPEGFRASPFPSSGAAAYASSSASALRSWPT